jgi:hypothetical protein
MAEQLYHAFTVFPGMRYRVVVYAEQRVQDRCVEMSSTELATYSMSNPQGRNRDTRMPTIPLLPSPAAAAAAEYQVVPQIPRPAAAAAAAEEQVVPQPLNQSVLKPPRMPQEPCGHRGEHG